METQRYQKLEAFFGNLSKEMWQRLGYVKESYKSRGALGPIRFGEETITDLMMMSLYQEGFNVVIFEQTSRADESVSGTDFEFWLGSDQKGWFRFAIQAKKLDLKTGRYTHLWHENRRGEQIKLLEHYARVNKAASLYCLYNYTEEVGEVGHWNRCQRYPDVEELGCTVTSSSNIQEAIDTRGAKNFRSIHRKEDSMPLGCLISCTGVASSLEAMSEGVLPAGSSDASPLFDPASCYHQELPRTLRPDGSTVIGENRSGGTLAHVRVSLDQSLVSHLDQGTLDVRQLPLEGYEGGAGIPKVAVTLASQSN